MKTMSIQRLKELEELKRDKARLDWLDQRRDHVRGTEFPLWKIEGYIEDKNFGDEPGDLTIRQAIDECMKNDCPG